MNSVIVWTSAALIVVSLGAASADTFQAASDMAGLAGVRVVTDSDGRSIEVVANANSCAPFQSRPVWSQGSPRLLGYQCFHNPNR